MSGEDTQPALLTKLVIPHSVAREVFERLEIAGIMGTHLFNNHEGAVADVVNSYVYGRRTGSTWD